MDRSMLIGLVSGLIAILLSAVIANNARRAIKPGELRYGQFLLYLGGICFLIFIIPTLILLRSLVDSKELEQVSALASICAMFGPMFLYCFGEYFMTGGTFDNEGIEYFTPWTGRKKNKWDSLVKIRYNSLASWYVLSFQTGKKIRISEYISGYREVLDLVEENCRKHGVEG